MACNTIRIIFKSESASNCHYFIYWINLSAFLVIFLGECVRRWFIKRRYGDKTPEHGKIYEIWKRYGVIGLGLLSPLVLGAPLGAAVGIGLGADRNRLLLWMAVGIVIWSIILTAAGLYGVLSFQSLNK